MIIFIAMVLVAAVAAGLLIDVASLVQQQAQETGTRAIADVSGGLKVMDILGDRANGTGELQDTIQILEIKLRLQSGSPSIYIGEVIIEITDGATEASLAYRDVSTNFAENANATRYTGESIRDPDNSWRDARFIADGTLVKVYINCTAIGLNLAIQTHVSVKFIPKHGAYTYERFTTPDSYGTRRYIELF
jgi:flagellin FlaB